MARGWGLTRFVYAGQGYGAHREIQRCAGVSLSKIPDVWWWERKGEASILKMPNIKNMSDLYYFFTYKSQILVNILGHCQDLYLSLNCY